MMKKSHPPVTQPNILFFLPDQHRFDWTGANPVLGLRTPHLDALMARGMTFSKCYTPAPVCSPARACLATGRSYERCGVVSNFHNTPVDLPTQYHCLRDAGYEVCGVGKFDLHKPDRDWGLTGQNMLAEYGFTCGCDNEGKGDAITSYKGNNCQPRGPYMQYLKEQGLVDQHLAMYDNAADILGESLNFSAITELTEAAYCDNWIADNGKSFLRGFEANKPWYLTVNFTGPHDPYDVTAEMAEAWSNAEFPDPIQASGPTTEDVKRRRRYYAAMIENIDRHIGDLLAIVDQRGELDNTIVVFSSDHGEMLGDHDRWQKGTWHEGSTHIPLVIAGPGVVQGTSSSLVSLHDLAATFVEMAGADGITGNDHPNDARSLMPTIANPTTPHRAVVHSGLDHKNKPGWRMVRDDRFKLVHGWTGPINGKPHDGSPLLFDLDSDPNEGTNVISEQSAAAQRLQTELPASW